MTTQHTTKAPQIATQPVSLVKSAPATYCKGDIAPLLSWPSVSIGIWHHSVSALLNNDLTALHNLVALTV